MQFSEFRLAMAKSTLRLDQYPDVLQAFETARLAFEPSDDMAALHRSLETAFRYWTPAIERRTDVLTPLSKEAPLSDTSIRLAAAISTIHDGHYELLRHRYERGMFKLTLGDIERLLLGCLLAYVDHTTPIPPPV